jgi:signal peptidase I
MLPGMGHAGRVKRGLALFWVGAVAQILIAAYALYPSTRIGLPFILAAALFSTAFALYMLIDAYRGAKGWNIQHAAPKRPRWKRALLIFGALLLVLVLNPTEHIARYVSENVVEAFELLQYSMEPTLIPGDRLLVDKRIYRRSKPQRGSVVAFRYPPRDPTRIYLKRIVGLPGDRAEIRSGRLYINGREVIEPYVKGVPFGDYGPETVPPDAYFVLGDYRNNSEDSRAFGSIPRGSLLGKVTKIFYPLDRSGPVE